MPDFFFSHSIDQFKILFNNMRKKVFFDNRVDEIKNIAWDYFLSTGLPLHRRGNEEWKYTNLNQLSETKFTVDNDISIDFSSIIKSIPFSDNWHNIVFINGNYFSKLGENSAKTNDIKTIGIKIFFMI